MILERFNSYLESIGYHYGDKGIGRDTTLLRMGFGSGRSTGHFGTGVYFLKRKVNDPDRPEHKIDTSNYNLLHIKSEKDGFDLHTILRKINGFVSFIYFPTKKGKISFQKEYDSLKERFKEITGKDLPPFDYIYPVAKEKLDILDTNQSKAMNEVSLSTEVIKYIGYNGIYVGDFPALDNFTYGSVIYEL